MRRAVPRAFVDADHTSGVAGDAVVREKIRRVGKDQIHGVFGNRRENFQAIALIDFDVVLRVVKNGGRDLGFWIWDWRFGIGEIGFHDGRGGFMPPRSGVAG